MSGSSSASHPALPRRHRWTPPAPSPTSTTDIPFDTGHPGAGGVRHGRVTLAAGAPASRLAAVRPVPGLMTAADFCMFVRPAEDILHMRMLRPTSELNSYMVLALFRSAEAARRFAEAFEGRPFLQGLVSDTCCVSAVEDAVMDVGGNEGDDGDDGEVRGFPGSEVFRRADVSEGQEGERALVIAAGTISPCPVCLDVLDARASALVTTLCNHTMHAACLAKWDLNNCPVCRHTHELTPEASTCISCGHNRGLWMCVICAYVGCGVYTNKHAQSHFDESHHPFAVILEDSTFFSGDVIKAGAVWDYVSARFVHRLLSSEDGKIVEVSADHTAEGGDDVVEAELDAADRGGETDTSARLESGSSLGSGAASEFRRSGSRRIGLGSKPRQTSCCGAGVGGGDDEEEDDRGIHTAIYVSELYAEIGEYRARVEEMETKHVAAQSQLMGENTHLRGKVSAHEVEESKLRDELASVRQELAEKNKLLGKRAGQAEKEGKDLREKNTFLKSLNETLLRDKQTWNGELKRVAGLLAAKETECREKEEQLRDMCLHLEAQVKMADASGSSSGCRANASGSEASGGDILGVGPSRKQRLASKTRRK